MGCCSGRCFLITLCILQMISTVERMVFDFLGYMWAPIIGDFLQIIFVIIGLISAYQYRPKVLISYSIWALIWIAWNAFVICLYLEVGILKRDGPILNISTGNKSWWRKNGIGCMPPSQPTEGQQQTIADTDPVPECFLQYYYVEIIHAGVQCLLSFLGFCVACCVIYVFTEEDDSWSDLKHYDSEIERAIRDQAQPVHDELEYIKMRYRSPARSSFRSNKQYETLTTQASTYSSMDTTRGGGGGGGSTVRGGGVDNNRGVYEDDTLDTRRKRHSSSNNSGPHIGKTTTTGLSPPGFEPDLPWSGSSPASRSEDYGFNTSLQPLYGVSPGQTVI